MHFYILLGVLKQGEIGLPGLRGTEGEPGKGIPGEQVEFFF